MSDPRYVQRLVTIQCRGYNERGEPSLDSPVSAVIDIHRSPGCDSISVGPESCPHNTGGHGQRCKASHPPGVDKVGDGVTCPFSFDWPYVTEFYGKRWAPPLEIAADFDAVRDTCKEHGSTCAGHA